MHLCGPSSTVYLCNAQKQRENFKENGVALIGMAAVPQVESNDTLMRLQQRCIRLQITTITSSLFPDPSSSFLTHQYLCLYSTSNLCGQITMKKPRTDSKSDSGDCCSASPKPQDTHDSGAAAALFTAKMQGVPRNRYWLRWK